MFQVELKSICGRGEKFQIPKGLANIYNFQGLKTASAPVYSPDLNFGGYLRPLTNL